MPSRTAGGGIDRVLDVSRERLLAITSSTGAWTLAGLTGGLDGQFLLIRNGGTDGMTIMHESGAAPAHARICTSTGAGVLYAAGASALLVYDVLLARWVLHTVG